jgi:hypothetical protein
MPANETSVHTIEEVLEVLDSVIARAVERRSRVGYFAAIYRNVTAKVAEGIDAGFFDDGERMARFDVTFANRYLAALDGYETGGDVTRSWELAFEATTTKRPIILQHLLVGINAHVNLDLGIAAAATSPGAALAGLRRDFDRINEILASMVSSVQHDLAEVSPWIGLLDRIGGRHDDTVIRFSLEKARTEAWRFATELAPLPRDHWAGPIKSRDARVARVANAVLHPGWLSVLLQVIQARETNDVRRIIRVLNGMTAPDLNLVEARVHQPRAETR